METSLQRFVSRLSERLPLINQTLNSLFPCLSYICQVLRKYLLHPLLLIISGISVRILRCKVVWIPTILTYLLIIAFTPEQHPLPQQEIAWVKPAFLNYDFDPLQFLAEEMPSGDFTSRLLTSDSCHWSTQSFAEEEVPVYEPTESDWEVLRQEINNDNWQDYGFESVTKLSDLDSLFQDTFPLALRREQLIAEARKHLGTPYLWGGRTPRGFDCMHFTRWIYQSIGYTIPYDAQGIYAYGQPVEKEDLQVGDVLFFRPRNRLRRRIGHLATVCEIRPDGEVMIIHAVSRGISIDPLSHDYYTKRYIGARRILF